MFILTMLQGFLNAVLVTIFVKWGFIEFAQIYLPKWLPFNCHRFCLPFWLSVIQLLLLLFISEFAIYIFIIAFMSPALTQKLLQ